uniref:Uncharacterized protein n=1 Tax=Rhizophora mucronata TaxID=61149 RepID=A0A2P2N2A6_RHIMU
MQIRMHFPKLDELIPYAFALTKYFHNLQK